MRSSSVSRLSKIYPMMHVTQFLSGQSVPTAQVCVVLLRTSKLLHTVQFLGVNEHPLHPPEQIKHKLFTGELPSEQVRQAVALQVAHPNGHGMHFPLTRYESVVQAVHTKSEEQAVHHPPEQ